MAKLYIIFYFKEITFLSPIYLTEEGKFFCFYYFILSWLLLCLLSDFILLSLLASEFIYACLFFFFLTEQYILCYFHYGLNLHNVAAHRVQGHFKLGHNPFPQPRLPKAPSLALGTDRDGAPSGQPWQGFAILMGKNFLLISGLNLSSVSYISVMSFKK